jgi:hypothetical protein
MADVDISGWVPKWAPAREQLTVQRSNLLGCKGHRIVDRRLVWDLEHDKWFADLPVILTIDDGLHLGVRWQKLAPAAWTATSARCTPPTSPDQGPRSRRRRRFRIKGREPVTKVLRSPVDFRAARYRFP